jgi:pyrimidine-nucleoside phosphorylase
MGPIDINAAKRDGRTLSDAVIREFVSGVVDGGVTDYQAAAWLMAVTLRGMTVDETVALTLAMRDSGSRIDRSGIAGLMLDKHSTGGVGDKTTLIVVPLLAAAGVPILKMSGRGLGLSGGTLDKLESIPGFRTDIGAEQALEQVRRIGAAIIGQSEELVPADRILYALRDVTATVESIPLIAASIMSKKLAAGADRILLDVKVGSGAFMKRRADALKLARLMVEIGSRAGVPTEAALTAMDAPLGYRVGNALEVLEAIALLRNGHGVHQGLRRLCLTLAAHGLVAAGKARDRREALGALNELIRSGAAAEKFAEIVAAQGGPSSLDEIAPAVTENRIKVAVALPMIESGKFGVVAAIDAGDIGRLATEMGAGRRRKDDAIDPGVGVSLMVRVGTGVGPQTPLAWINLRSADESRRDEFSGRLRAAFRIEPPGTPVPPSRLVLGWVRSASA